MSDDYEYIIASGDLRPLLKKLGIQLLGPSSESQGPQADLPVVDLGAILDALLARIERLEGKKDA